MDKICRRLSDGSLWRPSFPDDYNEGKAIADALIGGKPSFYFRGIQKIRKWGWTHWKDTGEIWQFNEPGLFRILDTKEIREIPAN